MAIFIPGMRCTISGKPIPSVSDAVMFPAFVLNEADPIHIFSDAVIKADVFSAHPLAAKAQARYEEFQQRAGPYARFCLICGERVTDPDNYMALGYLVEDPAHALYKYNYTHFHKSCLKDWPELSSLVHELEALNNSSAWKGGGLYAVIEDLAALSVN